MSKGAISNQVNDWKKKIPDLEELHEISRTLKKMNTNHGGFERRTRDRLISDQLFYARCEMGSLSGKDYFYRVFLQAGKEYLAFGRVPSKLIHGNVKGSGDMLAFQWENQACAMCMHMLVCPTIPVFWTS